MKITIKKSDIDDEVLVCPYCLNPVADNKTGCCGESNAHFEIGYILNNGYIYLKSEVTIKE